MTADEAIKAHKEWKERFFVAMAKREQLDVERIALDNCCKFGKWLHGVANENFGHLASYRECVALHAEFHRAAANIAQEINAGQYLRASQDVVGHDSPYAQISAELTISVVTMFREATGGPSGSKPS